MNATATRRQMIQGAAMLGSVAALGTMAGSAPAQAQPQAPSDAIDAEELKKMVNELVAAFRGE